jgi:hypothetical protein
MASGSVRSDHRNGPTKRRIAQTRSCNGATMRRSVHKAGVTVRRAVGTIEAGI